MSGNATTTYRNVAVLSVTSVLAPLVTTSFEIERRLEPVLKRLRLPTRLLERVAGVIERRYWSNDLSIDEATLQAGNDALKQAGVKPGDIGLLINTSVTKQHIEPSVAVRIHHGLGLPSSAINFDISNACLGFVNGMNVAARMIESGQIDYAMVVNGEDVRDIQLNTIKRLQNGEIGREQFMSEFASLTLGCGTAAAVLGRFDRHPEGHRVLGGITRASTQFNDLCVGTMDGMLTNSKALLKRGMELVNAAWTEAKREWDWSDMDRYIMHQVSDVHTDAFAKAAGLDKSKIPVTYPKFGNVGPASIPITLAEEQQKLHKGDRVLLCGVGSGINTSFLELAW